MKISESFFLEFLCQLILWNVETFRQKSSAFSFLASRCTSFDFEQDSGD